MSKKFCVRCGDEMPVEQFYKTAHGTTSWCKHCFSKYYQERDNPMKVTGDKTCTQCYKTFPVRNFYRDRKTADGLRNWCKKCCIDNSRKNNRLRWEKWKHIPQDELS